MNTIDFEINKHAKKIGQYEYFDVVVFVDGKEIPYDVLNGVTPLAASQMELVDFDLFTCDCGEPGCAGFMDPISQEKTSDSVVWKLAGKYEKLFETSKLVFNRQQFEEAFNKLYKVVRNLEDEGSYLLAMLDTHLVEYDDQREPYPVDQGMKYYKNVFYFESMTNNVIKNAAPDHYDKKFLECYDGECSRHLSEFSWIVNGVMNDFCTQHAGSQFFMAKVKYATKAVVDFIEHRNHDKLEKIISHQYRKSGLSLSDLSIFTQSKDELDWNLLSYIQQESDYNLSPFACS